MRRLAFLVMLVATPAFAQPTTHKHVTIFNHASYIVVFDVNVGAVQTFTIAPNDEGQAWGNVSQLPVTVYVKWGRSGIFFVTTPRMVCHIYENPDGSLSWQVTPI